MPKPILIASTAKNKIYMETTFKKNEKNEETQEVESVKFNVHGIDGTFLESWPTFAEAFHYIKNDDEIEYPKNASDLVYSTSNFSVAYELNLQKSPPKIIFTLRDSQTELRLAAEKYEEIYQAIKDEFLKNKVINNPTLPVSGSKTILKL